MKKSSRILVLAVILILLMGGYYYMSAHPKKDNKTATTVKTAVLKLDASKIASASFTSKNSKLNIKKSGKNWISPDSPKTKIDQKIVGSMINSFCYLSAQELVDNSLNNISQYGLDKPGASATFTLSDGSSRTVLLGNKSIASDAYYAMVKGESKIYTIDSSTAKYFEYTLANIKDTSMYAISQDTFNYLKFKSKDGKVIEMKKNGSQAGVGTFTLVSPYESQCGVAYDKIDTITKAVSGITLNQLVEMGAADLSKYGLDKPVNEIVAKDNKNTLDLLVGKNKDDSNVYVKTNDSNDVYVLPMSTISNFDVNAFDIVDKDYTMQQIDDVDRIDIINNGEQNSITIKRKGKAGDKNSSTVYTVNNKNVKEDDFNSFYQTLIGLSLEGENDKELADKPEIKTVFYLNKGSDRQLTFDYVPYNSDYYAVFKNGKSQFLISKTQLEKMTDALKKLTK